jgi:hypothetical protein
MTDPKKKEPPVSPLAQAMRSGTLGVEKQLINGDKKAPAPDPVPQKETESTPVTKTKKDEKRRRITAYVAPDIYQWTKVRAALEDRELSEIVEDALRQYKKRIESEG